MATIQEKIKGKKIVSFKIKACVGRDEKRKQIFRCTTWYPPEELTNAKARKEVQKVAILWEDEAKQLYLKELEEGKPVAGVSRSFVFGKFVYEVWVPLCVKDGSHRPSTVAMYTNILKIIVPQFAGMSIKEITGVHISQYLRWLRSEYRKQFFCHGDLPCQCSLLFLRKTESKPTFQQPPLHQMKSSPYLYLSGL